MSSVGVSAGSSFLSYSFLLIYLVSCTSYTLHVSFHRTFQMKGGDQKGQSWVPHTQECDPHHHHPKKNPLN